MSSRLSNISNQVKTKVPIVENAFDYLRFEEFLTPEENQIRLRLRKQLETEVEPTVHEYIEKQELPAAWLKKLRELDFMKYFVKAPYGQEKSLMFKGIILSEFFRIDSSVGTHILVLWGLTISTIERFGSEEQKQKYIPKLMNFEWYGGWGLTEEEYGSDASNIQCSARKVDGGYIINGNKTWIGNADGNLVIVWARDTETKKVNAFIVHTDQKGFHRQKIQYKLALRSVQNMQMQYTDLFVSDSQKLPGAKDFAQATNPLLVKSRMFVLWNIAGICQGVYDRVIRYISERKQFGVPISSFQLQQEKLMRIMANTQAIMLMAQRLTQLATENKVDIGEIALGKAYCSERGREVVRLGREMFGGNGIIHSNYVMKAFCDMEAMYTYEGTYDINALIAGRHLTGIAAFKVPTRK